MALRNLNETETKILESQGNRADDWKNVQVAESFKPDHIHSSYFSGSVTLGKQKGEIIDGNGNPLPCGVWRSHVHDCQIGDGVHISDVSQMVGYDVDDGVIIQKVGKLIVSDETTFGNGVHVHVINETGGRAIPIYEGMSSQFAYIMAMYRHDDALIQNFHGLIEKYVNQRKRATGKICQGARIIHCGVVENVWVGESAVLEGVLCLENGTITDCRDDPICIGSGVSAKDFIIHSGSKITNGTVLNQCFVGQGVRLENQFTAEHSCFFANADGFQGEASSVFAGPFTVTHHKSTLLIASLFSFFNAGSGTNQSNHMYKLGALHQGIMERGCKTGSFSYLMWPGRIGAFTTVIGKHANHVDTSDFPFSMLKEHQGRSVLSPAMNLMMVGPQRDGAKWPERDRRKGDIIDLLHYPVFSPYTAERMMRGIKRLIDLDAETPKKQEWVETGGVRIKRAKLVWAAGVYDSALKAYAGETLLVQIEKQKDRSLSDLLEALSIPQNGEGKWIDVAGLLAPKVAIEQICDDVRDGKITSLSEIQANFLSIYEKYDALSYGWCVQFFEGRLEKTIQTFTKDDLTQIINDWMEQSQRLLVMALKDASKEFSPNARLGYGHDGDDPIRDKDFEAVIGSFNEYAFVQDLRKKVDALHTRGEQAIQFLEGLK